jgi:hypothetical protein
MDLTSHQRATLEKIFAHPLNHNIEWHDVVSLLDHLGAAEPEHDGGLRVTLGARTEVFRTPHHKVIDEQQVLDLRRMLAEAGITPAEARKR